MVTRESLMTSSFEIGPVISDDDKSPSDVALYAINETLTSSMETRTHILYSVLVKMIILLVFVMYFVYVN